MSVPEWVISVCVGAAGSLLIMSLGRSKALRWGAWYPIFIVMGIDATVAAGTLPVLETMHPESASLPMYWHAIAAGVVGPAIIRAKSPDTWRMLGGRRLFGPFRSIQEQAETEIEKICTAAEVEWLDPALVKISYMTLEEVKEWTVRYLGRLDRKGFDERTRRAKLGLVRETAADDSTEEMRKRTIVQILLDADGHRAVRSLVAHAQSVRPKPLLRRHWFDPRLSEELLYRKLVLPVGFRKDKVDGRVRIGYQDRRVDDSLYRLAQRIVTELPGVVRVEGVYEGWITVSLPMKARECRLYQRIVAWLTESVTTCAATLNAVVQSDCTVLDEGTGLYATASLVVSSVSPAVHDNAFCGTAFCAQPGLRLAAEVVIAPSGVKDGSTYKKNLYCRAGVPVYLVFDTANNELVVYSDPENGDYRNREAIRFGEQLVLPKPLDLTLDTAALSE